MSRKVERNGVKSCEGHAEREGNPVTAKILKVGDENGQQQEEFHWEDTMSRRSLPPAPQHHVLLSCSLTSDGLGAHLVGVSRLHHLQTYIEHLPCTSRVQGTLLGQGLRAPVALLCKLEISNPLGRCGPLGPRLGSDQHPFMKKKIPPF